MNKRLEQIRKVDNCGILEPCNMTDCIFFGQHRIRETNYTKIVTYEHICDRCSRCEKRDLYHRLEK